MTLAHTTAIRNGLADYVADQHDTGAGTSKLEIRNSANTVLITFNFPNPAFGAAAAGVVSLNGTPIVTTASAAGTAANFVTRDRAGTQILSGTVTAIGGGGDIEVTNTSIASGQDAQLTSMSYAAAA